MPVPDFQALMLPLLRVAAEGQERSFTSAVEQLAQEFRLTDVDRADALKSGQSRFYNRVGWARTYLVKAGLLRAVRPGWFQATDRGRELLLNPPPQIDIGYLRSHFPEISAFRNARPDDESPAIFDRANGKWNERAGVEERITEKLELAIPDESVRRAALDVFGWAIEAADEDRSDGWYVRETEHGLRLMAGRLLTCEVRRSKLRMSVIGPVLEETRDALGAEIDDEFKWIPGGQLLALPLEQASATHGLLKDGLDAFIDSAMARVRSSVSLDDHTPEAISYLSGFLGRELPQPEPGLDSGPTDEDSDSDEEGTAPREPRVRGRAPIFENEHRSIASLISDIEREVIALPDLQRPFVWEDTKVRDLLDSLFWAFRSERSSFGIPLITKMLVRWVRIGQVCVRLPSSLTGSKDLLRCTLS
jgi:Mrr N-terminal domain